MEAPAGLPACAGYPAELLSPGCGGGDVPLQGWVFGEAPARHLPFQASGRSNSPFSHKGRRGQGDEGQKARECSKPRIALKNAAPERGMLPTIRAHPSHLCRAE